MSVMDTIRARTTLVECDRSRPFHPNRTLLADFPGLERSSYDTSEPLSLDHTRDRGRLCYDEFCLELTSRLYDFQRSDRQSMTEYGHVVDYSEIELVKPMRVAFSTLGSLLRVQKMVPYGRAQAAFIFYHTPINHHMVQSPYMILDVRQPGVIVRSHWLLLHDMTSAEQRIIQDMRSMALNFNCPQVCMFDGLNLISIHYKGSGDKIKQARAHIEITFDHHYTGYGGRGCILQPPPLDRITGELRATIRESCFTMLLEGVRRVACTVLTRPMNIDTTYIPALQNHIQFWSTVKHLLVSVPTVARLRQDPYAEEVEPITALHRAPSGDLRPDGSPKLVVMFMWFFDETNILQFPISKEF